MIYLTPLIFGLWNGFVIEWKQDDDQKASDIWHKLGRVVLLLCALPLAMPNMADWYTYILNPVQLINGTDQYIITLSALLFFCFCWSPYNMLINLVNEWKWNFIGRKRNFKLYWTLIMTIWIVTILFGIFGKNFEL